MKKTVFKFGVGLLLAIMPVEVKAMPMSFTHQGIMRDGGALVNGTKMITAVLYDDESNEIVGRATKTILIQDGFYSFTIENLEEERLRETNKLTLGIKVGNDAELTPRLVVDPVPYAMVSKYSEQATALDCIGCVGREQLDFSPNEVVENLPYAKSDEVGGPALEAKKLICTNCVTSAQAAFNFAGSSSRGGPASAVMNNSIITDSIANSAVVTNKVADKAITTEKLADKAITTGKLADSAVTTAKIGSYQITEEKLATSSVTTTKIKDGSITSGKLASRAAINNLNADGYYAPVAWASYQRLSTSAASAYNNVLDYMRGNGGKLTMAGNKQSVTFTFDTPRPNILYAIDVTFQPSYEITQSEYARTYVTKVVSKTKSGFNLQIYRCVAEVDGTNGASCGLDTNWIAEGTHLLIKIFD